MRSLFLRGWVLRWLPHQRVEIGVLDEVPVVFDFLLLPVLRAVLQFAAEQPCFQLHELLEEVGAYLEVVTLTIEILQGLVQGPLVLADEICRDYGECA